MGTMKNRTRGITDIQCVNPCVTGDRAFSTENGYTPARDLQLGIKIRTPAGLKPIEKLYNNGLQRHLSRSTFPMAAI